MKKIVNIKELMANLTKLNDLKLTILCHGVFDVLHIGHIRHLQAAKEFGDILIVSITSDKFVNKGVDRPIFNEKLRAEVLSSLDCVDYVYINDEATPINLISILKPNYYVKGNEYNNSDNDITGNIILEKKAIEKVNGELKFTNGIQFSSSNIINKHSDLLSPETHKFIEIFKQKNNFNDIINYFDAIRDCRVLVIGEAIIDEYLFGRSLGKSAKSPIVALGLEKMERYVGGSLIIANHLSDFVNVDLFSVINPEDEKFIISKLNKSINYRLYKDSDYVTVTKRRYLDSNQKIFETYKINKKPLQKNIENAILKFLQNNISKYDLVIISDFGHGLFTSKIRHVLKIKSSKMAINTQMNAGNNGSNTIRKYWDRNNNIFICIDEAEVRMALCDFYNEFYQIEDMIRKHFSVFDKIAVTRAQNGCIIYGKNEKLLSVPAFAKKIIDPMGAGDAFLSLASLCYIGNKPSEWMGFIGNVAGAIIANCIGNRERIEKQYFLNCINTLLK